MEKIKTLAEYQQLASRTCPDLGTGQRNADHMWLGITTEIGELLDVCKKNLAYGKEVDITNVGEEIADKMWYIANSANFVKEVLFDDITEFDATLYISFLDLYKSYFDIPVENRTTQDRVQFTIEFYQDFFRHFAELHVQHLVVCTKVVSDYWGFDFYQILTNNIQKLQIRYPEKFTNEAALNRDLGAEREVLEQADSGKVIAMNPVVEELNEEQSEESSMTDEEANTTQNEPKD